MAILHNIRDVFGRFTKNSEHGYHSNGDSPFFDILMSARNKGLTPGLEKAARVWMQNQAKNILVPQDSMSLIGKEKGFVRRQINIGQFYMFKYDAKHKDTLPYWDMFPFIVVVDKGPGYFHGINFHYLARPLRARLMDALYSLATNRKYNDNQKLAISYSILKSSADLAPFKPCYKMYLTDHVRSPYYKIPGESWSTGLFLPTERFQKKAKTFVWQESAKIIKKNS